MVSVTIANNHVWYNRINKQAHNGATHNLAPIRKADFALLFLLETCEKIDNRMLSFPLWMDYVSAQSDTVQSVLIV